MKFDNGNISNNMFLGLIKGMIPAYVDANEITISSGYCEANGKFYELTATTAHLTTAVFNNGGIVYCYIDDDASTAPTPTFVFSATAPVWSDAKQGMYNGDDRVICGMYCTGVATIEPFYANDMGDGTFVYLGSSYISIASSMNPDGTWQTPDDAELSLKCPRNAVSAHLRIIGGDSDSAFQEGVKSYEASLVDSSFVPELIVNGTIAHATLEQSGWVSLGPSTNIRVYGNADDDNVMTVGYHSINRQRR